MPDRRPLPAWVTEALMAFLDDIRSGKYAGGGQITFNASPQAVYTSAEPKGRIEPRRDVVESPQTAR